MWIYLSDAKKVIQIDNSSEKLDWKWPYTPDGVVHYTARKNSGTWCYVPYGETKEELATLVTRRDQEHLNELKAAVNQLESKIETLKSEITK